MVEWNQDTLEAFEFYNISPDKAEWVSYREYCEAPPEDFEELVEKYKLLSVPSEPGKIFLVER